MWNKFNIYSTNGTSKFIINNNNNQENNTNSIKDINLSLKLNDMEKYHTNPSFVLDSQFNEIFAEDFGEEKNDLLPDRNSFYITNFLFREFEMIITYESNDLGFSFQNIFIPYIDVKN